MLINGRKNQTQSEGKKMLTAEIIQKMYTKTNHVPVNARTRGKTVNSNVSKEALSAVLDYINSYKGFITVKTLEFKTNYARSTLQRVVALLAHQEKIQTKTVKNGRANTLHIKGLNK